jgi:AcrR family transcriptional regulator
VTAARTEKLPSGRRATLSRADVVAHQRRRLLWAMVDEVAERGYPAVSVAHVIARAGVSRATFYEQFDDKETCFLAAFDAAIGLVLAGSERSAGVDELLATYLDRLAANPALARVFLLDIQALGPVGVLRRTASQQRFVEVLSAVAGARTEADRFAGEAFVAATGALVTAKLAAGEGDTLRDLHAPLVALAQRMFPRAG